MYLKVKYLLTFLNVLTPKIRLIYTEDSMVFNTSSFCALAIFYVYIFRKHSGFSIYLGTKYSSFQKVCVIVPKFDKTSAIFRNRKPTVLSQSLITQYGWLVFLNMFCVVCSMICIQGET